MSVLGRTFRFHGEALSQVHPRDDVRRGHELDLCHGGAALSRTEPGRRDARAHQQDDQTIWARHQSLRTASQRRSSSSPLTWTDPR